MLEATLFLFQVSVALPVSQLRSELLKFAVAVVLLSLGVVAVRLFFFRSRTRELTQIYFGIFSILFGVRLLADLQIVRSLFPYSKAFWEYVDWVITCTILLPFGFFLNQIVGERLKRFYRWVLAFQAMFTLAGILGALFRVSLKRLHLANSIIVLATVLAVALFFLVSRRDGGPRKPLTLEIRVFTVGFAVWLLFVVQTNILSLKGIRGYDFEFLGLLAFVCSLGYVTAHRSFAKEELLVTLNKELEIARQIQSSILPREVPQLAGLEVAARYVPMSAVAGDFYDFLVVDAQHAGILVADVSGHGVPAALIASMLKVAFAGQSENAEDPGRVLTGLNRALCGKFEEHFVTAAYVFVDLEKRVMRYAGAGHPPLLLASRSNGGVRAIEKNGLILGLFPEAEYASLEIGIHAGDRCLLYTDGLFEAMNAGQEEFGKERLVQFLQSHSDVSASRLSAALLEEVSRWSGHASGRRQEDDITLLVLDF